MKNTFVIILLSCLPLFHIAAQRAEPDVIRSNNGDITIQPILHGSLVLEWNDQVIYVDPYGGPKAYEGVKDPTLVFITDVHGDHLDFETLKGINLSKAKLVVPQAVADRLSETYRSGLFIIENGETESVNNVLTIAIPMYNLPESSNSRHPKGRGNGYIINLGGKNIYISGDTEDIPEMRTLQNIEVAFVCMNLPYTMDIDQAASAVLDFDPKIVYPFHYRGKKGLNDVEKFKKMVNDNNDQIEVRLRNWYPEY